MTGSAIRLHVDQPLAEGQAVLLDEGDAHYLFSVMRMAVGASLSVFNGRDGEWQAEIGEMGRKRGILICQRQISRPQMPPDLWLLFAPLRRERTAYVVEKAVELGVARILPVITRRTNAERFRADKARAHAKEAAEQCGAIWLPEIDEPRRLDTLLADWPSDRALFWADETLSQKGAPAGMAGPPGPGAILIGPEGGFTPEERDWLAGLGHIRPFALGPRILRAETAAVAALVLWQSRFGDWAGKA